MEFPIRRADGYRMSMIFISYNRKNRDTAQRLSNDIESLGHDVWLDQELSGGQAWWDKILEMVREHPSLGAREIARATGVARRVAADLKERTLGMLCHLLAIFTWFLGPLIVWLMKKDSSWFVDDQGKEALNFQITIGIFCIAGCLLAVLTCGVGILFPIAVGVLDVIFCIMATVAASNGERYRYPFALRIIR